VKFVYAVQQRIFVAYDCRYIAFDISASEVTTIWRYTNVYIIIIIIIIIVVMLRCSLQY